MNFKPTLWKSIVSIIAVFIVYFSFILGWGLYPENFSFLYFVELFTIGIFSLYWMKVFFMLGLIAAILIYIIWSLFQKK